MTRPVDAGLWVACTSGPQLVGSRCRSCRTTVFPRQQSCPRCSGRDTEDHLLPSRGTLWSFTVQGFPPKAPYAGPVGDDFVPYGVGYVQLDDEVVVETRLTESDPDRMRIGDPVELVIVPAYDDVVTFAFAPVAGAVA
jgi:uncharacterized OB-fold protein